MKTGFFENLAQWIFILLLILIVAAIASMLCTEAISMWVELIAAR